MQGYGADSIDSMTLDSETLASNGSEACFFVLSLREAVAHSARRNTRSMEIEMGISDDSNAHTGIAISASFGVLGVCPTSRRAEYIVSSARSSFLCR